MAEVFPDVAFFWKCQTYQNWNILGNTLTKHPTDSRMILVCRWPICPPVFPPLTSPMANVAGSQRARNEVVSNSGLRELYSWGAHKVHFAFETVFERLSFTVGRDRNLTQDLHIHSIFIPFEPHTGSYVSQCVWQRRVNLSHCRKS